MWSPFLHPPKKAFLFLSVWPRREYTWIHNWKDSILFCFANYQQRAPYSHRQSRNRVMNTFTIINIIGLFYACPLKKGLPSPFSLAKNIIYSGTHLKEKLIDLFWKPLGYLLFPYKQSRQRMVITLPMVNINSNVWRFRW